MSLRAETIGDICRRLETTEGHLRAVRRMAEEGKRCEDLLVQLTAVRAAIEKTTGIVLREHLDKCLRQAIATGQREAALSELDTVVKYLVN